MLPAGDGCTRTTASRRHCGRLVPRDPQHRFPPAPLFEAVARLGVRFIGYDRAGYGGSTPASGRDVESAARDTAAVADSLELTWFAVLGHSGRGSHTLACAALLPDRVMAAAAILIVAPLDAAGLDWFAGTGPNSSASLHAAAAGRTPRRRTGLTRAVSNVHPAPRTPA